MKRNELKSMKIILLSLCASALFAQTTVPIQVIPSEASVSLSLSAEAVAAITNFAVTIPAPGVSSTTLSAPITSTATSIAADLTSTVGMAPGMGLKIDSEILLINPNLTVTRGSFGTTAASHSSGAAVTVLRSGDWSEVLANILQDFITQVVIQFPGPAVQTQNAAIVTAQTAIKALQSGSVAHQ